MNYQQVRMIKQGQEALNKATAQENRITELEVQVETLMARGHAMAGIIEVLLDRGRGRPSTEDSLKVANLRGQMYGSSH